MKKKFFYPATICLIFFRVTFSDAQNLVSNCSFEQYDTCPDNEAQIQRSVGWFKTYGDADYFNSCSATPWSVPPQINYQLAASGNAFAGVIFFSELVGSLEVIHTQLAAPLSPGITYYVSFQVNLCLNNSAFMNEAINKIGAKFTTGPPALINNSAQVFTNSVITDTANWTTISGSFVADSAYTHLYLGVFFDTASVTSIITSSALIDRAYYFVDDVVVSSNPSQTCDLVGIEEASSENSFLLFPNPAKGELRIKNLPANGNGSAQWQAGAELKIEEIKIYDALGVLRLNVLPFSPWRRDLRDEAIINISSLPPGTYFITIIDEKKNRFTRRFVKL